MEFRKYHGLGNDFLVVQDSDLPRPLAPGDVRRLCDRRRGVGGDGVLVVGERGPEAWSMDVHNADGSRAEMCGNGLRCVGRFIVDHLGARLPSLRVETGGVARRVQVDLNDVRVDMGAVRDLGTVEATLTAPLLGRGADVGNPHLVLFGPWDQAAVETWGPTLEHHERFPSGVNVSFARVCGSHHVELAVWERGCGATQACGTGACATVVTGWLEGRFPLDGREVQVDLPGGTLYVGGEPTQVTLRGPAVEVYRGWVDLDALSRAS